MIPQVFDNTLLRFAVAGSVDDGKSTLIGRLLYECKGVYQDQVLAVANLSRIRGSPLDLSLITDGLRAEREQSITIDVAYRYFSTPRRKFIIADTPGHEQYTRNMVTGASRTTVGVLLMDARNGATDQTRRHACILALLGVKNLILAVNKMDLVAYDAAAFAEAAKCLDDRPALLQRLRIDSIPVSALAGDNVVLRSKRTDWYDGPSLLGLLESIPGEDDNWLQPFRFPVQMVIRAGSGFRGYAGQIHSGTVQPGQEVLALPSGRKTAVTGVDLHERSLDRAGAPQSVVISLADQIDLSRGDMLVDPSNAPFVSNNFSAELIWMSEDPLRLGRPYLIKHTNQVLCCRVTDLIDMFDVHTLQRIEAKKLQANDIGRVRLETYQNLFFDTYQESQSIGSFILIDPQNNNTIAAGLILGPGLNSNLSPGENPPTCPSLGERKGMTVWFTGLSGSGKSTLSQRVATELLALGYQVEVLDGDVVRKHLSSDLGFSRSDRDQNIRRIGLLARMLSKHGVIVLVSAISPYRNTRDEMRRTIAEFMEVYVNAPLSVCEIRDPKGLYRMARAGELNGFTGISDPYEPPMAPDLECCTHMESVKACSDKIIAAVLKRLPRRS